MSTKIMLVNTSGIRFSYKLDSKAPESLENNHCHNTYEILFVVSGEGKYLVEGSTFDIKPGTLLIVRPFEYHSVSLADNTPYERYVFHFSESSLIDEAKSYLGKFMINDGTSGKYYSSNQLTQNIFSLFERYESCYSLPEEEKNLYTKIMLSELIILLSLCDGTQMNHNGEDLGARVIRYLNENIDKDVSLERLSKRFYVSKYYLCRAFKKHNGISIHGYINYKRVMYAKRLMDSGETASGAAYRVGFGDYSAFYRAYVKVFGKSPTAD